ncbi:hypothetical protein GDO78_019563 [Eleutherodactylus coqui]|uniref:Taste receptor type 2 n=1 Tax=Eleutherodactylus coqui TaxID=57060 RepID=A0A8J6C6G0_ELECQ|nr:hypothetical protein GDO78_019563 [Eleutherodactylus coqui]
MADPMEDNTNLLYQLHSALIALIAGLVINSFIIGVNVTDWWKGRSVTPVDHIVTSLGIARICAQCVITVFLFVIKLLSSQDLNVSFAIGAVYALFIYTNFWLTSLLSIVFCLKISNFHSRLFLYLRGMIVHRTVYFIAGSVLLSVLNCLMPILTAITDWFRVILFTSLYHHTRKMKMNENVSINLETYYSAMKFVFFTFIYNTTYFFGHFISIIYYYFYRVNINWHYIVLEFLPALHSSYLIYRTAKLRSQMAKGLQYVIHSFFQSKNAETRENIDVVYT